MGRTELMMMMMMMMMIESSVCGTLNTKPYEPLVPALPSGDNSDASDASCLKPIPSAHLICPRRSTALHNEAAQKLNAPTTKPQ
ncbi:hypothetical protein T11_13211 [Trichinella zimbabwensis]|uniref:Secreted protein n=1 Tax=Trichinella zimbabwensis TaxID=268475 RepID=A0A0V1HLT2_9BILA|nr:hypothetical protein T11_13211 [Trichinella zimbabwensis]